MPYPAGAFSGTGTSAISAELQAKLDADLKAIQDGLASQQQTKLDDSVKQAQLSVNAQAAAYQKTIEMVATGPDPRLKGQKAVDAMNQLLSFELKAAQNLATAIDRLNSAKASANGTSGGTGKKSPKGCKFNLPPHLWSLPVRPIVVDTDHITIPDSPRKSADSHKGNKIGSSKVHNGDRRAVIWFYDGGQAASAYDSTTGSVSTASGSKYSGGKEYDIARNFAFQWLWNPETIATNVQRNMNVTPSSADRFTSVQGIFPGMETVSVSVTLDRTNDFACFKTMSPSDYISYGNTFYGPAISTDALPYDYSKEIRELMSKGTVADIDYLFRAINGDSPDGKTLWKNLLDRPTPDTGYLQPSIMAVRFGPDVATSLSYVGWINALDIQHTAFTENMIPIRSTVQFSMQCLTGQRSV